MPKPAFVLFLFLSVLAPSFVEAGQCPVINGTYKFVQAIGDKIVIHRLTHFTRQERGIFSYTIDGKDLFQRADGVARPLRMGDRTGKITLVCGENSLISLSQEDGFEQINRIEMTMLDERTMKVETNLPDGSGIYTRE